MAGRWDDDTTLDRYRGYLLLVARLRVGPRLRGKVDPSDLVQQTLLKAHQSLDQCRVLDEGARAAWLRTILTNTAADEVRRYSQGRRDAALERSLMGVLEGSSARIESLLLADQSSPSRQAIRHEQMVALGDALRAMPEDRREAIELHYLEGLPLADIATRMGRTRASVAGLLRRGIADLRVQLNPGANDDDQG
jgi:RNA polymerase sigma-70 factor (ECF subfamily)